MTYTKKQLYRFTTKLYKLFKEEPQLFQLKKLRGVRGWCITDENGPDAVLLDYREDLIAVLIHECIHYFDDDLPETVVVEMGRNIVNQLSIRQIKTIIKRFAVII